MMPVRRFTMLLMLAPLFCLSARAQDLATISGRVTDAASGEPLAGAHVFLSNTTLGTTSDAEGRYELRHVPTGPFELVASMIGFETWSTSVVVEAGSSPLHRDVRLRESIAEMATIEVSGERPRRWRQRFMEFEKELLGESPNGREAEIVNPYVLDFENEDGALIARASEPLIIDNPRLGYRLHFVLTKFRLEPGGRKVTYEGKPRFEEIPAESASEARQLLEYREAAYNGSLQHLLWSIIHDRVSEEGFDIQLDDRAGGPLSNDLPEYASVRAKDLVRPTASPGVFNIQFDGYLNVVFDEPGGFSLAFWRSREPDRQVSWLTINDLSGLIHEDGTSYPPGPVAVSGYMTQLRLADYVPRDFARALQWAEFPPVEDNVAIISETGFPQNPSRVHPAQSYAMETVVRAIKAEDWDTALDLLDSRLKSKPDDLEARYYRGIVHREVAKYRTLTEFEHWKGGRDDFDFILARDSTYRDVLYQLALFSRVQTDKTGLRDRNISYREAIRLGERLIRLKPDVAEHQFDLFTLYRRFVSHTEADDAADWLRRQRSDYALFFLGEVHRREGRLDAADRLFEQLLSKVPKLPLQPILLAQARVNYEKGDPQAAESLVRRAVDLVERPVHAGFLFEDVKYIVSDEELAAYRILQTPDEYVAFFDAFWLRRNPLPSFDVDVRMAEHYRRLLVAEREHEFDGYRMWFNNPDKTGNLDFPATYALNSRFNDRGLVYLRLGEPSSRIMTVSGQADPFQSSLGAAGQRSVFEPKDQSYRAGWQPNESWRYADLGLDFHFVIDEGGSAQNWRLAPYLTNYEMLKDRMEWGGHYVHMAHAASEAEEHQLPTATLPNTSDRNNEASAQTSSAVIAFSEARAAMADSARVFVSRGLAMDRHTWGPDAEPLTFPFVDAAFRGRDGETVYELSYALPTGRALRSLRTDSIAFNVGVAVHDTSWGEHVNSTQMLRVPRPTDEDVMFLQSMRLRLPPDSYHVALSARVPETPFVGGYKFDRRIPDFSGRELSMSDLLPAHSIDVVVEGAPDERSDFRIVPSLYQRFSVSNPLFVYFEVYNLTFGVDDRTKYAVEYTIQPQATGKKRIVGRQADVVLRLEVEESSGDRSSHESAEIDLSAVPPGAYLLTVAVRDLTTGLAVSRAQAFELVGPGHRAQ